MRRSGFYKEIVGSPEEPGERYYFLDGASVEPGGSDAYVRDWVVAEYENTFVSHWGMFGDTYFSATVYVRRNDVILAYRGTSEFPEWINDVEGFLSNLTLEEPKARDMVRMVARKYAASGKSVYITGHSLGGYLAQVGAAELIRDGRADKLRRCEYFNGMGLDYAFWAGFPPTIPPTVPPLPLPPIMPPSPLERYRHSNERNELAHFNSEKGGLVLHRIYGDPVSLLGLHSGRKIRYDAAEACVRHHKGMDYGPGNLFPAHWLRGLGGSEPIEAAKYYGFDPKENLAAYTWSVHETDSFFYRIRGSSHSLPPLRPR